MARALGRLSPDVECPVLSRPDRSRLSLSLQCEFRFDCGRSVTTDVCDRVPLLYASTRPLSFVDLVRRNLGVVHGTAECRTYCTADVYFLINVLLAQLQTPIQRSVAIAMEWALPLDSWRDKLSVVLLMSMQVRSCNTNRMESCCTRSYSQCPQNTHRCALTKGMVPQSDVENRGADDDDDVWDSMVTASVRAVALART